MFWTDAIDSKLDRLRRYAAFACGSQPRGDQLVCEALENLVMDADTGKVTDLQKMFTCLDKTLRDEPQGHADTFAEFGRWQFLGSLERRLVLLVVLEGFTCQEAADITGMSSFHVRDLLGRARLKYADRFPARVGLVGADDSIRDQIGAALDRFGYRLVWSLGQQPPPIGHRLESPSALVVAGGRKVGDAPWKLGAMDDVFGLSAVSAGLPDDFAGPVIVANETDCAGRISSQIWSIPAGVLADPKRFRRALVQALLFSN